MLNSTVRPRKTVTNQEYHELVVQALTGSGHTAEDNDNLFYELDRARVVPASELPSDLVQMGSWVCFRDEEGATHAGTLVYPQQVHSKVGQISVLTPVGTALFGLRAGQEISYRSRTGHCRKLTPIRVKPPAPAPAAGY